MLQCEVDSKYIFWNTENSTEKECQTMLPSDQVNVETTLLFQLHLKVHQQIPGHFKVWQKHFKI